jgi:hypothetical protein
MGIKEKDFLGKTKREEINTKVDEIKSRIENNNRNIYTKYEISKLRRSFISSCVKIIDDNLKIYKKELNQKCQKIKYVN